MVNGTTRKTIEAPCTIQGGGGGGGPKPKFQEGKTDSKPVESAFMGNQCGGKGPKMDCLLGQRL